MASKQAMKQDVESPQALYAKDVDYSITDDIAPWREDLRKELFPILGKRLDATATVRETVLMLQALRTKLHVMFLDTQLPYREDECPTEGIGDIVHALEAERKSNPHLQNTKIILFTGQDRCDIDKLIAKHPDHIIGAIGKSSSDWRGSYASQALHLLAEAGIVRSNDPQLPEARKEVAPGVLNEELILWEVSHRHLEARAPEVMQTLCQLINKARQAMGLRDVETNDQIVEAIRAEFAERKYRDGWVLNMDSLLQE